MAEKTKLWYLHNFNLLEGLDEESMMNLEKRTVMKEEKKRSVIFFPDEASETIYLLKGGKVKISRVSEDGRSTTLQLVGPGEIFGESALLGQRKHENIAEVVEDALICAVSREMFEQMMEMNPNLRRTITKFIGFRLRRIQAQVEDLVFKDARERITAFLKRYANTFGKPHIDGWMVRPFLTHQEIADLTATTRQTANSILSALAKEGKIHYSRRYLKILASDLNAFA